MSKGLNEDALARKTFDKLLAYGRLATFTEGTTEHSWYMSPPVTKRELDANSNQEIEFIEFLVADLGIPFTPVRTMKMVDSKDSLTYRIIAVQPLDSGLRTNAWKLRASR